MSTIRIAKIRMLGLFVIIFIVPPGAVSLGATAPVTVSKGVAQGKKDKKEKGGKNGSKAEKRVSGAPTKTGVPALWESRGNVSSLNLFWGIGGPNLVPKPPFTFDKEDVTGTNPKIKVIDAKGVKWNVKFDEEVHSEVAASRIAWACGYMVEESYFVPSGRVQGVGTLTRARKFVRADGSFTDGMFEKRPDTIARRDLRWAWDSNPFVGKKELSGLAILNTMLNNWDAKTDNNNVLGMYDDDGVTVKEWYIVSDWGATFGKMGSVFSHNKWDLDDFRKQRFIDGVSGGSLKLHYSGRSSGAIKTVPLDHARWFAGIVGQITDNQLRAAFKAAGASESEVTGFAARLREKINELKGAVGR
jgi:hypothetical protein